MPTVQKVLEKSLEGIIEKSVSEFPSWSLRLWLQYIIKSIGENVYDMMLIYIENDLKQLFESQL